MPCYSIQPAYRRSYHYNPYAQYFSPQSFALAPRFSAPFFRGLEDEFAQFDSFFKEINETVAKTQQSFQPKFDVKEESDKFVLHGELPGVQPGNLQIEFLDRNTMLVKGKVVRQESHGTTPAEKSQESAEPQDVTMSGAAGEAAPSETSTTNYHKASVEEEAPEEAASEVGSTASAPAADQQVVTQQQQSQEVAKPTEPSHYWVSERTVGEFSRSFRFPGKVNQDAVKATLKDGILTVDVPKLAEQDHRRQIEIRGD